MTPNERIEQINKQAQGDPMVIARELVKVVNELEAENARLDTIVSGVLALEVVGGEFVDAVALYRVLGEVLPVPVDHAANIRARIEGG